MVETQLLCAECGRRIACCNPDGTAARLDPDRRGCVHVPLSLRTHPFGTTKARALLAAGLVDSIEVLCLPV
jgi:hypothetical protein